MKKSIKVLIGISILITIALSLLSFLDTMETAKKGNRVAVDYWLTADGKQIDTSEGRGAFEFTLGAGEVIPGFDKAVTGMSIGEEKTVKLSGNDAYTVGPLAGKELTFRIILREIQ